MPDLLCPATRQRISTDEQSQSVEVVEALPLKLFHQAKQPTKRAKKFVIFFKVEHRLYGSCIHGRRKSWCLQRMDWREHIVVKISSNFQMY